MSLPNAQNELQAGFEEIKLGWVDENVFRLGFFMK